MKERNTLEKLHDFLTYLQTGNHLKIEGRVYAMTEDLQLYIIPYQWDSEKGDVSDELNEDHPLGMMDMPLGYWTDLVEKIPDNAWEEIQIQLAFTRVHQQFAKKRG